MTEQTDPVDEAQREWHALRRALPIGVRVAHDSTGAPPTAPRTEPVDHVVLLEDFHLGVAHLLPDRPLCSAEKHHHPVPRWSDADRAPTCRACLTRAYYLTGRAPRDVLLPPPGTGPRR